IRRRDRGRGRDALSLAELDVVRRAARVHDRRRPWLRPHVPRPALGERHLHGLVRRHVLRSTRRRLRALAPRQPPRSFFSRIVYPGTQCDTEARWSSDYLWKSLLNCDCATESAQLRLRCKALTASRSRGASSVISETETAPTLSRNHPSSSVDPKAWNCTI